MPRTRRDGSQCFKHMSDTTSENDDGMLSKDQADLSSFEEDNSRGMGSGTALKKGPWTSAEDAILIDYVKKHGEGNWNAVQKYSGLSRCGKSCRLRWANHLRPNLKKGSFTAEEERLIIELHAKLGNKWARMAAHLPGRTDNEIKNYWNTRIKRRQRAGLPLYSPDTSLHALSCQQSQNMGEMNGGNTRQHGLLQAYYLENPDVIFENDKANPGALSYAPLLPNVSVSSILNQGLGPSQSFIFMPTTMHCDKRPQESEASIKISSFNPFQNDSFEEIHQPFGLGLPYDPDLDPDLDPDSKNSAPFSGVMTCSHAYRNGNFSASMPLARTVKQELPSLQHSETNLSRWGTCSPASPSLEDVDAYVQSPCSPTVQMQSESLSGQNSGLLQSIFHDSQTMRNSKTQSFENGSNSAVIMPTDRMDSSTLNVSEEEWNGYGDPISPLGYSAASVFNESTPISSCSLDESPPCKVQLGSKIKTEPVEYASTSGRGDKMVQLDFSRPDTLLGADFFDHSHEYVKDLATFVGDDFFSDYKNLTSGTNSATHGLGLGANGIT